jgi:acetyltransferase-like isoleucine patch superfamily enzyme
MDHVLGITKLVDRCKQMLKQALVCRLAFFCFVRETVDYKHPITFDVWFEQKVVGRHKFCYWPIHRNTRVVGAENVRLGVETFPGYMPGCYIQALGKIEIGDHSIFSANVGLISSDHDLCDVRIHKIETLKIGSYCLVGMNSVVLPGVQLGDFTIVGAGSVVTRSFPQGYCVIAGNPAKLIKHLDPGKCVRYSVKHRYHGYLTENEYFERFPHSEILHES